MFATLTDTVVTQLKSDPETTLFIEYFEKYYASSTKDRASCHHRVYVASMAITYVYSHTLTSIPVLHLKGCRDQHEHVCGSLPQHLEAGVHARVGQ